MDHKDRVEMEYGELANCGVIPYDPIRRSLEDAQETAARASKMSEKQIVDEGDHDGGGLAETSAALSSF
jgi:hypothetical protein